MLDVYISKGNLRMDFPTWSIPSRETCPGKTENCTKYCYAAKSERIYRGVLPRRTKNLESTRDEGFADAIVTHVNKLGCRYFRIHESGDFYSQGYLDKWIEIAKRTPEVQYLIYSQNWELDWSLSPANFVVYWSIWPDTDVRPTDDGRMAFVIDSGKGKIGRNQIGPKTKICVKGQKGFKDLKCNDCMYCYKGEGDVAFKLH